MLKIAPEASVCRTIGALQEGSPERDKPQ